MKRILSLMPLTTLVGTMILPLNCAAGTSATQGNGGSVIYAGNSYSLAVKKDGSLWAWGVNNFGQLDDGTEVDKKAPIKIMDNVNSIDGKGVYSNVENVGSYSAAIKKDSSLMIWGEAGDIGNGKPGYIIKKPIKIMDKVKVFAAGWHHQLVVKTDGSLWAWGDNHAGQLGDGTEANKKTRLRLWIR